jgi:RNA polymerase sigma factor (sigma-70 family)
MTFQKLGTGILSGDARSSYEIWISEIDSSGAKRDLRVVQAAQKMRRFFLQYRQSELGCPSLANTLAEEAVDNVCRTLKNRLVRHPHTYLKTAFVHAVNRYLRRERRLISVEFERDDETLPKELTSETDVKNLEQIVQIQEILTVMDPQTLSIFAARRAGYTGKEIAKSLGVTTSTLYSSYSRGLTHVIETLGLSLTTVRENQQVHGSERQREKRKEEPARLPHPKHS